MFPFRRPLDGEKQQLHELNSRLARYLSRTQQLEQENAHLAAEVARVRQAQAAEWEPRSRAEVRGLRRQLEQLSLEKSRAEVEREKLRGELQMVRSLCSEQTEACRDVSGELRGCEQRLHVAHQANSELQQRLLQLESQCRGLEDAHRHEVHSLRRQVESRAVPVVGHACRGAPVVSAEEVHEYARALSEGWMETFEMFQQQVEEMERAIGADRARLGELQREKALYASELERLRAEAEKQSHVQSRLEEQLMTMQEKFHTDLSRYQMIIEQLEHERDMMADTIGEKMNEHQHLLQVKMDLGIEVAAYRALLEGERVGLQDIERRVNQNQNQRERIIDIKMPSKPYTPRASVMTSRQRSDIRHTSPVSSLRRSPVPPSGSISPSRIIPISVADRARYQSPASRRDMISFSKAQAAASIPATSNSTAAKDKQTGQSETHMSHDVQGQASEEKTVRIKQDSRPANQMGPIMSSAHETRSVRVVSPPMMSLSREIETEVKTQRSDDAERDTIDHSKFKDKVTGPNEKKILDSVSVEEIIEKVIKPAGIEAKVCPSGESKIRYHVEESELEDGTTKTRIVLESKVEEELDVSEDTAMDELLNQGVKKVSLEDIKDTATGSMIKNLLSDLQGAQNVENKSIKVEIIEEPVDSHSDEELEVEQKSTSTFYEPSSTYFQIEELENVPREYGAQKSDDEMKSSISPKGPSIHVEDVFRPSESPYFSHDNEQYEYFVSTPDDNLSDPEEGGGITSYGHYGIVDDLSDERYYQDESLPSKRVIVEESGEYKFTPGDHPFVKESFPECIIEEEVCVSPVVQESVLEFLRQDSLEPKEQLEGALETLQSSVSGPLREELAFLAKLSRESPENVAVNVKTVRQSSDDGTMTIVAEMNVSQTLEDSGLLEADDDLSEEQILEALKSSNLGFEKTIQGGAGVQYSYRVAKEEDVGYGEEYEGFANQGEPASEITEKRFELGPSEKTFTFKMDSPDSHFDGSSVQELPSQTSKTPVMISEEKRVATIYLESSDD